MRADLARRRFLQAVSASLLAAPFAAEAQTPGRIIKLGILSTVNPRTTASEMMRDPRSRSCIATSARARSS